MEWYSDLEDLGESGDGMVSVGGGWMETIPGRNSAWNTDSSSGSEEEYTDDEDEVESENSMESDDCVDGNFRDSAGKIQHVDLGDPKSCISVLQDQDPSMKTFASLNRKLKSCPSAWMEEFLVEGGLDVLLGWIGYNQQGTSSTCRCYRDVGVCRLHTDCHEFQDRAAGDHQKRGLCSEARQR